MNERDSINTSCLSELSRIMAAALKKVANGMTGMAPTYDWMIKIVKVNKLYRNSLIMSTVNRVSRSGTMKYQCE